MIEHPVPQNVSSYQFRLVGDMTLKQFLELAGGIFFAWLIWTLNLPTLLKWPMAIGSVLFGFALAFLPIEDRPLDQWVLAFLRAIYRPTLFIWKKRAGEDLLQFTPHRQNDNQPALSSITKAPSAGLSTLLEAYRFSAEVAAEVIVDPLEKDWAAKQQSLPGLFNDVQVPKNLERETTFPRQQAAAPEKPTTTVFLHPLSPPANPEAIIKGEITLTPRQPRIPANEPDELLSGNTQPVAPTGSATTTINISISPEGNAVPTVTPTAATDTSAAVAATTTTGGLLPTANIIANIIGGAVFTADGKLVEGAIIEIRDANRLPVRALKTNKLGQFTIATPLANGAYELEIEKDGLAFDILKLEAKGEIIPPLEIKARP